MTCENTKRGFTLIELLVVIAILAVLAVAVVLVLNPAELLKQGRDTTRISDLAALNSAIALYVADVRTTTWSNWTYCTASTSFWGNGSCTQSATTTVDGTGWVPVKFTDISSGSPLARLPLDPTNVSPYYYGFAASTTVGYFELDANMESTKYASGGSADVETNSKDGGNNGTLYEVGSSLTLIN